MKTIFFVWTFDGVLLAISAGVLVLLFVVSYLIVFKTALKNRRIERKKRKARGVLGDELEKLENDVKYYRERYLGKQDVVLSESIVQALISMLPSPNEANNSPMVIKKRSELGNGQFEFRIVEFHPGVSIAIKILPLNLVVRIVHRKDSMKANMMGVLTNIDTFVWDFSASGIRIVSDAEFRMMCDFIVSSHKVADETGLLDYNK